MLNFIAARRHERETVRELSRLSDHALADLGITRSDIRAIAAGAPRAAIPVRGERADTLAPAWGVHLRGSVAA